MSIYFCGGNYEVREHKLGQPREYYFGMVRPGGGKPYVVRSHDGAEQLYNLCQGHSALYILEDGATTAHRIRDYSAMDNPQHVKLNAEQIAELHAQTSWCGL